jgi:hypothetical protein
VDRVIEWLLGGDVSIQYLTHKLLLGSSESTQNALRRRVETEGYGAEILSRRGAEGHWDIWYYQRKWICTHYTLADLRNLGVPPSCPPCREMVTRALNERMIDDGGINFAKSKLQCDVCVGGMFLDYGAYFCPEETRLAKLAHYILAQQNGDGGFGWNADEHVSDPHTTICVLEGLRSIRVAGSESGLQNIETAEKNAAEYLLEHGLFMNEDRLYQKLSYPYRYRYDLLRALEYFADAGYSCDERMEPTLSWLYGKRTRDGFWPLENRHPGREHLIMEERGKPSRFITLKALYIMLRLKPGALTV